MGETLLRYGRIVAALAFSILKRIVVGETSILLREQQIRTKLSVSSNGSWWVKRDTSFTIVFSCGSFSILKRIVVGETRRKRRGPWKRSSFSILKRIVVGET